jgi:hypothetical protein
MSAWMFNHEGMNRVVDAIAWAHETKGFEPIDLSKYPTRTMLGARLFELNSKALYARYGNDPDYCDPPPGYTYAPSNADTVQLCKTMHCFLYQCSEGDVPETELFKALIQIMELLDKEIGHDDDRSPQWRHSPVGQAYDVAIWG